MSEEITNLIEQLDGDAEPGGVPFDDDFDPEIVDAGGRGIGPAYLRRHQLSAFDLAKPVCSRHCHSL